MKIYIAAHRHQTQNFCFSTYEKADRFISIQNHPESYKIFEAEFEEIKPGFFLISESNLRQICIKAQDDLLRDLIKESDGAIGAEVVDECIELSKVLSVKLS